MVSFDQFLIYSKQWIIPRTVENILLKHIPRTVENIELSQPASYCEEYIKWSASHIVESKYVS